MTILCRVGRKTFTHSLSQFTVTAANHNAAVEAIQRLRTVQSLVMAAEMNVHDAVRPSRRGAGCRLSSTQEPVSQVCRRVELFRCLPCCVVSRSADSC